MFISCIVYLDGCKIAVSILNIEYFDNIPGIKNKPLIK